MVLSEKVEKNFEELKTKKGKVKVPKLKGKVKSKDFKFDKKPTKPTLSAIVAGLIKSAEQLKKSEKKDKVNIQDFKILKEEEIDRVSGGYGTISKVYGSGPSSSYVDYEKLFSYLGKFKASSEYQAISGIDGQVDGQSGEVISGETMNTGIKHFKYFSPTMMQFGDKIAAASMLSAVSPTSLMDSKEWEQFKMWSKLNPAMYMLKMSIS